MTQVSVIQPRHETAAAINWIANQGAKGVGYVGLYENGETTGSRLGNQVASHLGTDAVAMAISAYPWTFAKADFATTAIGQGDNGRQATFFTAANERPALSTIGALQSWSEDHDFPLLTALSMTASRGRGCAPLNTIQIIDGLRQGLSIGQMGLPGYKLTERGWVTAHNFRLWSLVEDGLVEAHEDSVTTHILDPSYRGSKPFSALSAGSQAFYRTVSIAKELRPDDEWTTEELIKLAQKHHLVDEQSDQGFKNVLTRAVSVSSPRNARGVLEKKVLPPRSYRLGSRYADMLSDLVDRVARLDSSPSYAAEARDYALDTYRNPTAALRIALRDLDISPYRKA